MLGAHVPRPDSTTDCNNVSCLHSQGLSLSTVALIRIKYNDTKITNDTDWHTCHVCAIWNIHDFKTQIMFYILNTINKLNGHPWGVLPFPFNFVSEWDVSETMQGQTGLSFMTSVGGACPLWACQWKTSDQSHPWLSDDEYSINDGQHQKWSQVHSTITLSNSHSFYKIFQYFELYSSEPIPKLVCKQEMKLC